MCRNEAIAASGVKVQSIDQDGFLLVEVWSADGGKVVRSVHPDGNSFDMMHGLIVPKPRQTT